MKKYFPNKWSKYKKIPSERYTPVPFGTFMAYRVGGYDIPDDVSCIIRKEDVITGKIKEYVYKTDLGAKKKLDKIMNEEIGPSNITICDAHRIHYLPHYTANEEVSTDDMQDYDDEDLFDEETGQYED